MENKIQNLHEKAIKIAKTYRESQIELIEVLQEMDELKGYRQFDFKDLHSYAVEALELSA